MSEHASPELPSGRGLRLGAVLFAVVSVILFFALGGMARQATLVVVTNPAGATVRIVEPRLDDELAEQVARTGEARFSGIPAGTKVRLTVSAPGYQQAVVEQVLPVAGGEHRVTVHLASETALYTVRTEPPGAMIYLDGKPIGQAPAVLDAVQPGTHTVEALLQGYEQLSHSLEAKAGDHREIVLTLTPLPALFDAGVEDAPEDIPPGYARLLVESSHPARFFFNNAVLGIGLRAERTVPMGRHRVTARAEGRGTKWKMINVEDQGNHYVKFEFDEDPVEKAFRATDPNDPLYWIIRGGNTRNEGRYGDAVEMFKKALELDPSPEEAAEIHRQLSRTYPGMKMWDEAIEHTEKYLEMQPEAPDAPFSRELLKTLREKKAEAEAAGE